MLVPFWCQRPQAPIGLKGPDQPQLEPPLTPLVHRPRSCSLAEPLAFSGVGSTVQVCWSYLHLATELLDLGRDLQTSPWTIAVLWTCLATPGTDPGVWGLTLSLHVRAVSWQWPCPVMWTLGWMWWLSLEVSCSPCSGAPRLCPGCSFPSAPTLPFLMARDAAHWGLLLCSLFLVFSVSSHYAVVINIY